MGIASTHRPLAGHAVFLSASEPSEHRDKNYRSIPDAFARIEEAVLRVAGAVFSAGGTLVFGGHPSISPLIGYLCAQYQQPIPAEGEKTFQGRSERPSAGPRVELWQSEAFRQTWAEPSERLWKMPGVAVTWTPAEAGERFDETLQGKPQCVESLFRMRREMIERTQPIAMIVVGGMEGVEEELVLFRKVCPRRTVYTLPSTGGAARILVEQRQDVAGVKSYDDEVRGHVMEFRRRVRAQQAEMRKERDDVLPFTEEDEITIPYGNVASRIVADIVTKLGE